MLASKRKAPEVRTGALVLELTLLQTLGSFGGFHACKSLLDRLSRHKHAWPFLEPVDAADVPDYHTVITQPMDIGTIKKRLDSGFYSSMEAFAADFRLMVKNAQTYNESDTSIHKYATELGDIFERAASKVDTTAKAAPQQPAAVSGAAGSSEGPTTVASTKKRSIRAEGAHGSSNGGSRGDQSDSSDGGGFSDDESGDEAPAKSRSKSMGSAVGATPKKAASTDAMQGVAPSSAVVPGASTAVTGTPGSVQPPGGISGVLVASPANVGTASRPRKVKTPQVEPKATPRRATPRAASTTTRKRKTGEDEVLAQSDSEDDEEEEVPDEDDDDDRPRKRSESKNSVKRERSLSRVSSSRSNGGAESDEEEGSGDDDDEDGSSDEGRKGDTSPLERIFAHRVVQPDNKREFYVKWKNRSYMAVEWVTEASLEEINMKQRIRLYIEKRAHDLTGLSEPEYRHLFFPAEYLEVERVIDSRIPEDEDEDEGDGDADDDKGDDKEKGENSADKKEKEKENGIKSESVAQPMEGVAATGAAPALQREREYLVKWLGLPYAEATWETAAVLANDEKIAEYERTCKPPEVFPTVTRNRNSTFKKLEESPTFKGGNQLRAYQVEGMSWLLFCWLQRRGAILADEMGLGKTIQAVAFLNHLWQTENVAPFLVVAPLSTIPHWHREVSGWTDMNVLVYHGRKADRDVIREHEWEYPNVKPPKLKFQVLLTTYEMLLAADAADLLRIPWAALVVDEAQRLKSHKSKLTNVLLSLKAHHKVLLTGTPLQNNTQELWTLLNFIEPNKFGTLEDFRSQFGTLENSEQVAKLHKLLLPHLLRRMKEDVEKSIPPKEETIVEVELTVLQKQYYRAMLERNRQFLMKGGSTKNFPSLMNIMMQLRKVCNHPFLVETVEEKEREKITATQGTPEHQAQYLARLIDASGKLVLVDKLLPKLQAGGHRVLIFSQMVRVLDILEMYLQYRGYKFERIDGGVRGNDRQAAIDRFSKPGSDRMVFLLCTRAGGVGINLASADTVIIYDSDWNPQNDVQAQARCHRIGQKKDVKVYRLLSRGTYEREMFERANRKLGLDQAVLANIGQVWGDGDAPMGRTTSKSSALIAKEIDALLRRGAVDMYKEEESSKKFNEEDIDVILQRSKVIVYNDSNAEQRANSTFSKASFTNTAEPQLDINAEDFWSRFLPEEINPENLSVRLTAAFTAESGTMKPGERESLLADMRTLCEETIALWHKWSIPPENASSNLMALLKLLDTARGNDVFWTAPERASLDQWANRLGDAGKRKRRGATGTTAADTTEGLDAATSAALKKARKEMRPEMRWSRYERRRFVDAFLALGPLRWEQLKQVAQLKDKTLEQIRVYANAFLRRCMVHSSAPDEAAFFRSVMDMAPTETPETPAFNAEPSLLEPIYSELIKRKVKTFRARLQLVLRLNELRQTGGVGTVPANILGHADRKPAPWWTAEDDKALLVGAMVHGYGSYGPTFADASLPFTRRPPVPPAAAGAVAGAVAGAADGAAGSAESAAMLGAADATGDGEVELRGDEEEEEKPEQVADDKAYPIARTLDARVKILLQLLDRAMGRKAPKPAKLARGGKSVRDWTKAEKAELKRVLMMYGRNWEKIRKKSLLQRTPEQIEEYGVGFLAHCKSLSDNATHAKQGLKPNAPAAAGGDASMADVKQEEAVDDDDEDLDEVDEPANAAVATAASAANEAKNPFAFVNTALTARKIVARVDLLDDIRTRVLSHAELDTRIKQADKGMMAHWWEEGRHDSALLRAIVKYGVGNKKVVKNREHAFFVPEVNAYKGVNRKQRKRYLKEFLEDKVPLVARLKYLRKLVLFGPAEANAALATSRRKRQRVDELQQRHSPRNLRRTRSEGPAEDEAAIAAAVSQLTAADHAALKCSMNFKSSTREIQRDADGKPKMPITARGATVLSLGHIVSDKAGFHSKNYLWPVGFESTRRLPSLIHSGGYTMYHSKIELDGTGEAPLFSIFPEDTPDQVVSHSTSSGAWVEMLKRIKKRANVSVSGPEMYGYSDPTVQMLFQELPGARNCTAYQWKHFTVEADDDDSGLEQPTAPAAAAAAAAAAASTTEAPAAAAASASAPMQL